MFFGLVWISKPCPSLLVRQEFFILKNIWDQEFVITSFMHFLKPLCPAFSWLTFLLVFHSPYFFVEAWNHANIFFNSSDDHKNSRSLVSSVFRHRSSNPKSRENWSIDRIACRQIISTFPSQNSRTSLASSSKSSCRLHIMCPAS